jgi:hypothetical protein
MKQYFPLLLLVLVAILGCGGGSSVSANGNYPNASAGVAARANEPRQNDPTGTSPPTMLGGTGSSGGLSSTLTGVPATPPPSSSNSKKKPDPAGSDPAAAASSATDEKNADGSQPAPPAQGPQDPATPKKISARHVLVQWMGSERAPTSVVRSREQAMAIAQEVLKRARAGNDFARLAVDYSDEPGAAARGGSLGRFGRGQMVGAFEAAAFKLSIGQISDIVESPFGYHIIQRTE